VFDGLSDRGRASWPDASKLPPQIALASLTVEIEDYAGIQVDAVECTRARVSGDYRRAVAVGVDRAPFRATDSPCAPVLFEIVQGASAFRATGRDRDESTGAASASRARPARARRSLCFRGTGIEGSIASPHSAGDQRFSNGAPFSTAGCYQLWRHGLAACAAGSRSRAERCRSVHGMFLRCHAKLGGPTGLVCAQNSVPAGHRRRCFSIPPAGDRREPSATRRPASRDPGHDLRPARAEHVEARCEQVLVGERSGPARRGPRVGR